MGGARPAAGPQGERPYAPRSPSRAGGPRPASPKDAGARQSDPRPTGPRTDVRAARPSSAPPERGGETHGNVGRPILSRATAPRPAPNQGDAPAYGEHRSSPDRARLPETPRGTVWLYGHHAVEAALGNPARRLRRLILTEEAETALTERRPQPWPLTPERTERARIDQLLGRDTVHQGAALLADPLPTPLLTKVLERPGVVLVLDQVVDPRNIGAVLRSAAAFGACCVITQDRNAPEETGALAKAASGALEIVPLVRAVNLARTLVALKAAGFWTVGLDSAGAALSGPALAERRVALVLGAEGSGLRRLVRETCDEVAGLAMPGTMESLNVSAAATVALYELSRRA